MKNATTTTATTLQKEIAKQGLNLFSLKHEQYIETAEGCFYVKSLPNTLTSKNWVFEQVTDADGEPFADGPIVTITPSDLV